MSSSDAKLAYLLDLGFDLDKCLTALNLYDDLQEASNWLLTTQTEDNLPTIMEKAQSNQPLLSPPPSTSTVGLSNDTSYQDQQELDRQRVASAKRTTEILKQKRLDQEARRRILSDIREDRAYAKQLKPPSSAAPKHQEASAAPADTTTHSIAEDIEQTTLSHIQQELRKQKQLDRVAKQKVLDDIKRDRMEKQQKNQSSSSSSSSTEPVTQVENARVNSSSDRVKPPPPSSALIQFKLSNGSTVRHSFDGTDLLDSLYRFVRDQEATNGLAVGTNEPITLASAFPRRLFGPEEKNLSVQEAGFIPNVSLNVGRITPPGTGPSAMETAPPQQQQEEEDVEMQHDTDEDEDSDDDDDDDDEHFIRQPVVDPHRSRRRRITDRSPFARQNRVTNPNWSWGQPGHRLGDDTVASPPSATDNNPADEQEDTSRRQNMLTAIEQRAAQKDSMDSTTTTQLKKINRNIKPLKETCASQVAAILSSSSKDTQRLLKGLVYISPNLANVLLSQLMATRKLDRLSISRLIRHCYLQQVSLDSYVYSTDSLLEELSNATTLTKLVLHGCDLITDAGIKQLESLRYLEYLDVSNCKITDKGLKSITELPSLVYLNMAKTHITDTGLQWFTTHTRCHPFLATLILSGCKAIQSPATFASLQDFSALTHVALDGTGIGKQQRAPMKHMNKGLETLEVGNTALTDDDLVQLFPNREHELDDILIRFTGIPLRHLDLTGFLNITDAGVQHIGQMKHLNYLSLTGTKVTDDGLLQLQELHELEKLYLDQTNVSDRGLLALKGLTKLTTLCLGRTRVSNAGLITMGNVEETRYASQLRTLNLQNCQGVSDEGVKALTTMSNLTNLNLDHTEVSLQCGNYLKDLTLLKPMRLQGIHKDLDDSMIVD
ncbi:hypothetical protein [Absidia glauca]|uniref:UBX domain-containing protein n=1 Tax=Absidia glauca TaxID=4829 RepID=A0A163IR45_ABSGL|nr:hypothetical protein [Absidia glauca]